MVLQYGRNRALVINGCKGQQPAPCTLAVRPTTQYDTARASWPGARQARSHAASCDAARCSTKHAYTAPPPEWCLSRWFTLPQHAAEGCRQQFVMRSRSTAPAWVMQLTQKQRRPPTDSKLCRVSLLAPTSPRCIGAGCIGAAGALAVPCHPLRCRRQRDPARRQVPLLVQVVEPKRCSFHGSAASRQLHASAPHSAPAPLQRPCVPHGMQHPARPPLQPATPALNRRPANTPRVKRCHMGREQGRQPNDERCCRLCLATAAARAAAAVAAGARSAAGTH